MDRALSFDYESNKIIRIWGYEKEVDQLSTSFLPIFDILLHFKETLGFRLYTITILKLFFFIIS